MAKLLIKGVVHIYRRFDKNGEKGQITITRNIFSQIKMSNPNFKNIYYMLFKLVI